MSSLYSRIKRKWARFRLQPIRIFCLHHVCAEYDADSMNKHDWMPIDKFMRKVLVMQRNGSEFISLEEAYRHIRKDWIRRKKYAVLTFDDGYASLKEILPWLEEQHIPVTLFINGKYLDGKSYRKNPKEQYLTKEELYIITSPLVEVGLHGWEHIDVRQMDEKTFDDSTRHNIDVLKQHPCFKPFYAYTWGKHSKLTDTVLYSKDIIPVYMDGKKNYNEKSVIHREVFI